MEGQAPERAGAPTTTVLWRCPQCRSVFSPEPTTILCPHCGENLRKCRYCRFGDTIVWECTNPNIRYIYGDEMGRFRIPEPDHYWNCPGNVPRLQAGPIAVALANPLIRALTYGAGVAVAVLLIVVTIILPRLQPPGEPEAYFVRADATVPRRVGLGDPIAVQLIVFNDESFAVGPVEIILRGTLITDGGTPTIAPLPLEQFLRGQALVLRYPPVMPRSYSALSLTFLPPSPRRRPYTLSLEVYAANYRATMLERNFTIQVD
ncbi:MAG: hydrogenase maturation nickel metallochaperone HypA [Armatimonadetes bacterium]|nr:hydrogenase maturation nickel metallochaperone HypA [Armatimonadota bacterium]MDW8120781.1 hypothetical protein [Armatimonadota bacterium]